MNILDDIVASKKTELDGLKAQFPLEQLKERARSNAKAGRSFRRLFDAGAVLIAEIKPKSPSEGALIAHSPLDNARGGPLDIAALYAKSDADVISVLTDTKYFGGSNALLTDVRARVPQLILRKDFIIEEYQVYETATLGADVFLLMATILDAETLGKLQALGESLGLEALVEVHDEKDLEKALAAGAKVIGINNRDLTKMQTDIATTERLAPLVPRAIPFVSESGIHEASDVMRVRKAGARGILVGTSILRSENPVAKIAELKKAL